MFNDYKKLFKLGFVLVGLFLIILLASLAFCFIYSELLNENKVLLIIDILLIVVSLVGSAVGIFILKKANKIKLKTLIEKDKKEVDDRTKTNQ